MRLLLVAGLPESLLRFRGPLIAALQGIGLEVHVAAPDLPPGSITRAQLREIGVIVHPIALRRAGTNPITDLLTLIHLWRLMREIRPDAVLAYTIKPVIYALIVARLTGVRRSFALITGLGFTFIGESRPRRLLTRVVSVFYRWALARADRVIFQNPDDRDLFISRRIVRREATEVVNGSGVDVDYFAEAPPQSDPVTFLLIARLLVDKGIREYVSAARLVKASHPKTRFLVVGPTDPSPAAIQLSEVRRWQEHGTIEYLGEIADVRSVIRSCSVYVLPSYREGTPRTNLEAMSTARPIITTDAPGCRETVVDGVNGFLVPVRDSTKLAEAMLRFVTDPKLIGAMGKESRKRAEAKYDVRLVNRQMLRAMGLPDPAREAEGRYQSAGSDDR